MNGTEQGDGTADFAAGLHGTKYQEDDPQSKRTGLYARVFAWMMARSDGTDRRVYGAYKQRLFAELKPGETVLEIGAGAGPNAAYFPEGIRWMAVEPNTHFAPYLRAQAAEHGLTLTILPGRAEHLPVPDASVDAALSTLVLCSVEDQAGAFAEILRVLKPGGRFTFIEHVAAPEGTSLRRLQQLVRIPWGWVADGCHPARETAKSIEAAGFAEVRLEHVTLPLGLVRPHILGTARKAGGVDPPLPATDL
ncbi:MAG: methyltransferase domain-containing protein [Rhodothermaceae bacterium]|nr:methyltransferase domain-containing protein [Rhodothermaceae bacterium]